MMESIIIKFPKGVSYTAAQFDALQALNKEVRIKPNKKGNQITFHESEFPFDEVSFFHVQLPTDFVITEEQFEEICNINDSAKLEFDDYNQLTINMLTTAIVSAFTALIIVTILNWARTHKKGRVYGETGRYDLLDTMEKMKRRAADASYLSYESAPSALQNQWRFVQVPPDLAIEVVSAPQSLQKEIDKMRNDWIRGGTKVGIVVNPHTQNYYVFELGDIGYTPYSFNIPFTHYLFPSLSLSFNDLLNEAKEQGS
ncbi:MAG: Uma2 family endonuclease [Cytophagales bacterium]|nr:MAG: Uma2 family endonuclease [Cytophagales bacterium]